MTPLLFVYGTLLSGDTGKTGRAQRARLEREARVIGSATLTGRLHNLGRYPALTLEDGAATLVFGELLELAAPERCLAWLDAYEGIVPGQHASNDYQRLEHCVTLADGSAWSAWVYVWRAELAAMAKPIPGGSWLKR